MDLHGQTLIRRSGPPVSATVGEEVVLMSIDRGECFGLGETGSEIWRMLEEPVTLEGLTARLREVYDAPEGELEGDLTEALKDMQAKGLVTFG